MGNGRDRFIRQLESASKRAGIITPAEAAVLFRRAALRIRSFDGITLEEDVDVISTFVAAEMNIAKSDFIRLILREWLEQNAYLPLLAVLDDDGDVEGLG